MMMLTLRRFALVPVIAVLVAAGAFLDPAFLTVDNLIGILRQQSALSLLVLAQAVVLIAGRIDLSLAATAGLAPALAIGLAAPAASPGLPAWTAIPLGLIAGVAVGAVNALLVVRLRLHAFAATLGTLIALGGLQTGFTDGRDLTTVPDSVASLDGASLVICGVIFAAAIAFAGLFRHGRSLYAVGGNADAARAAGIRPGRVLWAVFVAGGALAALAGLLITARTGSVAAAHNPSAILLVLAAALVGGVSLDGGKGTVFGALCGVLVFGLADNLMRLGAVAPVWVQAVHGGIVLVALMATRLATRRTAGRNDSDRP